MKIKNTIMMVLIVLLLIPSYSWADKNKDTLIIILDSISFKELEELENNKFGIGLLNKKSRSPYNKENFLLSLNLGRKVSKKQLDKNRDKLDYFGDVFIDEKPFYIGEKNSDIAYLIQNKQGEAQGENTLTYNYTWIEDRLDKQFTESDIIAMEYKLKGDKSRLEILKEILKQDRLIYLLAENVHKEEKHLINNSIVPILKIKDKKGILTSVSTKREGIVAIEDLVSDIKKELGKDNRMDIGKEISLIEEENNILGAYNFYKETINLLFIASIYHGILYFAQALLAYSIYTNKISLLAKKFYLFATNNILLSFLGGFLNLDRYFILYLLVLSLINYILVERIFKKEGDILVYINITYFIIGISMIFYPKLIYKSYIGFNNLLYGARFYGLNNGIAGVFLATSLLNVESLNNRIKNKVIVKFLTFLIPIINLLVLSTQYGANTGGFITSIFLLILVYSFYLLTKEINYKVLIIFFLLGVLIFAINIYLDSISLDNSHAIEFFNRIMTNGFGEVVYMVSFKLKELIKLTIMPPFSLVLFCQAYILYNKKSKINKLCKILLLISLLGFIINDTGNILLIYMLNYLILYMLNSEKKSDGIEKNLDKLYN